LFIWKNVTRPANHYLNLFLLFLPLLFLLVLLLPHLLLTVSINEM
jgi:hypothetical protein